MGRERLKTGSQVGHGLGGEPAQLVQEVQGHGMFGPLGPILHLDGHTDALAHPAHALDSLCPPLADHGPQAKTHHFRVKAAVPRHQFRVGLHGPAELFQLRCSGTAEEGKHPRQLDQLQLHRRDATVVRGQEKLRGRLVQQFGKALQNFSL